MPQTPSPQNPRPVRLAWIAKTVLIFFGILWLLGFLLLRNPVFAWPSPVESAADAADITPDRLRAHVLALAKLAPNRSFQNLESMEQAAAYIRSEFEKAGFATRLQDVPANGKTYHNVVARLGDPTAKEIVVIGAHYDVAGQEKPGADDNASGVAGLLDLARSLRATTEKLAVPVEFVAFALEEPPFFGGEEMGSAVHAKSLADAGVAVHLMISLEMIGYFSDDFLSQEFPIPFLYALYPTRGDFIAVVGDIKNRPAVRTVKQLMIESTPLPVYSINAPSLLPGIDWSDHRNYSARGWPAVMVTDTAFMRNRAYHTAGDTPDRLDYLKMAAVVRGVRHTALSVAKNPR